MSLLQHKLQIMGIKNYNLCAARLRCIKATILLRLLRYKFSEKEKIKGKFASFFML